MIAYEYRYNNKYYITQSGILYSIFKKGGQGSVDMEHPHKVAYKKDRDGYYSVVLSDGGVKRYTRVHSIVVENFIGDIPSGCVINHKDGNKTNNNVSNLEITTPQGNTKHAHANGLVLSDIRVDVEFEGQVFHFNSQVECISHFNDLSHHYLWQLRNNYVSYTAVLFERENSHSEIIAKFNGKVIKKFKRLIDADEYFNKSKGTTFAALKWNQYRKKLNKYHITFPTVSTIENTPNENGGNE